MLTFHQVVRLFNEAAQMSPEDADVHIVLGVLYNLSREYDKAIASFKTALQLKPQDYSLWNKLGATQANSIQSADAILAYQKVISSNTYLNFQLWSFFLVDNPVYILVWRTMTLCFYHLWCLNGRLSCLLLVFCYSFWWNICGYYILCKLQN